jgi:hypothetical protein
MNHLSVTQVRLEQDREHNVVAAASSLVLPGLGHIYKGRYGAGLVILLLGVPLSLWVGVLLSLATFGLGMIVPIFFWAMAAVCAYYSEDRRAHHPLNLL